MTINEESADEIAIMVLGWLVGNDELLPKFLNMTGASEVDIMNGLYDKNFLSSVLDFLTMNDDWVIACCDSLKIDYSEPLKARTAMLGNTHIHWT
ncbi:MAG: DUF3572 domain-containing protein [Aestuariivita sp.]|nr:DUF3572 domain-containing protein [Aestuariivita sp.]